MIKRRHPARRTSARLARTLGAFGVLGTLWFTRGVLISVALVSLPLGATPVAVQVAQWNSVGARGSMNRW